MQVAHIRPWREDVQNVKAMREAMGDGIEIMIDVNMGWDADTAIQAGHRIDEFDPYWLEEPVVAEDFAGYRRIAALTEQIMAALEAKGGRLPLHDNSLPLDIQAAFGVSKKAFKQAIGALFRERRIVIESDGIRLA